MILITGATAVDFLGGPVARPGPERVEVVASAEPLVPTLGGGGAGSAYVLARLGARPVLRSVTGQDAFGAMAHRWLASAGVDVSGVVRETESSTPSSTVLRDGHGGVVEYRHGRISPRLGPELVTPWWLERARVLLVAWCPWVEEWSAEAVGAVLAEAKRRGLATALSIEAGLGCPRSPLPGAALPPVDHLLMEGRGTAAGLELPGSELAGAWPEGMGAAVVLRPDGAVEVWPRGDADEAESVAGAATPSPGGFEAFVGGYVRCIADGRTTEEAARMGALVERAVMARRRGVLGAPAASEVEPAPAPRGSWARWAGARRVVEPVAAPR